MVFYDVHQLTNYSIPLSEFENIVSWVEYAKSNILYQINLIHIVFRFQNPLKPDMWLHNVPVF